MQSLISSYEQINQLTTLYLKNISKKNLSEKHIYFKCDLYTFLTKPNEPRLTKITENLILGTAFCSISTNTDFYSKNGIHCSLSLMIFWVSTKKSNEFNKAGPWKPWTWRGTDLSPF